MLTGLGQYTLGAPPVVYGDLPARRATRTVVFNAHATSPEANDDDNQHAADMRLQNLGRDLSSTG